MLMSAIHDCPSGVSRLFTNDQLQPKNPIGNKLPMRDLNRAAGFAIETFPAKQHKTQELASCGFACATSLLTVVPKI